MAQSPVRADVHVNVLTLSLVLVLVYAAVTAGASIGLSVSADGLHPLTRLVVWLVVTASTGYGLLRRYGRYPPRRELLTALGLAVFTLYALALALVFRREPYRATEAAALLTLAAAALFAVGAAGFAAAASLFLRVGPRP